MATEGSGDDYIVKEGVTEGAEEGPDGDFTNLMVVHGLRPRTLTGLSLSAAIQGVADADETTTMRKGTKVEALAALARRDYPGLETVDGRAAYEALATAIAPGVPTDRVLADFRLAVDRPQDFGETITAKQLAAHDFAFLGEDCVCRTAPVIVDGKPAAWIYSEFNTDTSMDDCLTWIDPENWPVHSPALFRKMEPAVGTPPRPDPTPKEWSAAYLETVRLRQRVKTSLRFDFTHNDPAFAALSYVIDERTRNQGDGVINVDRGFLSINDLGHHRHIKILKVVGFTDRQDYNNDAMSVCPVWTEFAKGAVEGGMVGTCVADLGDAWADLNQHAVGVMSENIELGEQWARAAMDRRYSPQDLARDSAGAWVKLAKDWSELWMKGYTVIESLADDSSVFGSVGRPKVFETFTNPTDGDPETYKMGSVRPAGDDDIETIVIPVVGLKAHGPLRLTDFVRLGDNASVLPADEVGHRVVRFGELPNGDPAYGLSLRVKGRMLREGIYCGKLVFGRPDEQSSAPLHFYVSRASKA